MFQSSAFGKSVTPVQAFAGVLLLVVVFLLIYSFFPVANDYYYYYYPVAKHWLAGIPSLEGNAGATLLYPPWTVIFLVIPLGLPPSITLGSAVLTLLTLLLLLGSIYLIPQMRRAPRLAVILAVLNLFTAELLLMGQLDAFTLMGVMLCWWALRDKRSGWMAVGFCLLALKPYNVLLLGVAILLNMRRWPVAELVKAFSLPTLMILSSLAVMLAVKFDWLSPLISPSGVFITDISIVLWRGLEQLGLPALPFMLLAIIAALAALRLAWRDGLTERTCAIVLCTSLVFTPYGYADYYVLLIPAFIYVARINRPLAMLAFALSFTPLLRLSAGPTISWVSVAYPAVLLAAAWFLPQLHTQSGPASVRLPQPG